MDMTAAKAVALRRDEKRDNGRQQFQFHGRGGEYFRIWIVNVSLTIMTLGIYSAWAKVRRNRYIYGSLELAGSQFDYLATPLQILRGRLFALAALGLYVSAQVFMPPVGAALALLVGLLTPWLIVRSRMFNMRYTAYRNIRFSFRPAYGDSYTVIFGYGLLSIVTLGLAAPYAHYKRNEFIVGNTQFGRLPFGLKARPVEFFMAYGLGAVLAMMLYAPIGALTEMLNPDDGSVSMSVKVLVPAVLALTFYYVVAKFVNAFVLRSTSNGTVIGGANTPVSGQLNCDWSLAGMLGIYLTNIIAIVVSLGLLVPWAQMRILRYQLNATWLELNGSLDSVIAQQAQQVSSVGEELGDVFDVDIGI